MKLAWFVTLLLSAQPEPFTGRVTDPQKRPVPGAVVHLRDAQAEIGVATSDASGAYSFRGVSPGVYSLSAESPGFTAVTTPADVTVATLGLEDDHTTVFIVAFAGRMVAARVVRAEIARRNGAVLFKRTLVT